MIRKTLWAADQPLRPQTAPAGGLNISKTIFYIFVRQFATVTEDTWGKIKILKAFSQRQVFGIVPNIQQVRLIDITDKIFLRDALAGIEVMFMGVKQGQAGADFAILSDGKASALDKRTLVPVLIQ
jgi:hypothetical protein